MWTLLRTPEEIDASRVYWPFTLRGSLCFLGGPVALAVFFVIVFEACQADGTCNRASWNEAVWGPPSLSYGFCESVEANGLIAQRMNTHSNLFFAIFGLIQISLGVADYIRNKSKSEFPRNHIVEFPVYTIYYGLCSCTVCLGSWLFHAHKTRITQQLDIAGIFLALPCFSYYPVLSYVNINSSPRVLAVARSFLLIAIVITGITQSVYKWDLSTKDVMIGHIVFFICAGVVTILARYLPVWFSWECSLFPKDQASWGFRAWLLCLLSGIVLGVGIICQETIFLRDLPCDGESLWQFHAVWHTCVAAALFTLYLFLRSERITYYGETDSTTGKEIRPEV